MSNLKNVNNITGGALGLDIMDPQWFMSGETSGIIPEGTHSCKVLGFKLEFINDESNTVIGYFVNIKLSLTGRPVIRKFYPVAIKELTDLLSEELDMVGHKPIEVLRAALKANHEFQYQMWYSDFNGRTVMNLGMQCPERNNQVTTLETGSNDAPF